MGLGALGLVCGHRGGQETIKDSVEDPGDAHHVVIDRRSLENSSSDDTDASPVSSAPCLFTISRRLTKRSSSFVQACRQHKDSVGHRPCNRFGLEGQLFTYRDCETRPTDGDHETLEGTEFTTGLGEGPFK
jgi:hypothetical protein